MGKNKKRQKGENFNDYIKRLEEEKNIREKDIDNYIAELNENERNSEKFLALNFYLITTNDRFNFNYLKKCKDQEFKSEFLRRLCDQLYNITSKKVKELNDVIFCDKIKYASFVKFYSHPSQELNDEALLISIKLGGSQQQRMICWKKNPSDNMLYVLGFQFSFNDPLYNH